ncbi:MAG: transporter substrate-binding domain-containing protein [Clostridiales bacterium]|jgi:polar amino acid transport system substrate-binding protein|nr:transporter substrate-binding domain-containing protein [Clostridiales bacterium]
MKKLLSIAIMIILALSMLSACGPGSSESEQPTPANRLEKILAEGKLTISTSPDYAPFEFIDPSKTGTESYVGSDMLFAHYIAEQLGVELVVEAMDFSAALAAVQEGKVDLCISGLAYKADRAKLMQLTDSYNLGGGQGVMVKTDALESYKTAEDFDGKLISAQNGSLQYENVETQLPNAKIEPVTNLADGIMMLRTGKVDALAMSDSSGEQYEENYDDIAMCEFAFKTDSEGNCVAVMNGEKELFDKMNEIIAQVNEKGLYAGWLEEASNLSAQIAEGE